ncbi:MAG: hypothetical protein ABIT70_10945 [Sulfuriferula sp.]
MRDQSIQIGVLVMAVWLILVILELTPVGPFVAVLAAIMQALYHIRTSEPRSTQPKQPEQPKEPT